jgi:hypothetical protein
LDGLEVLGSGVISGFVGASVWGETDGLFEGDEVTGASVGPLDGEDVTGELDTGADVTGASVGCVVAAPILIVWYIR